MRSTIAEAREWVLAKESPVHGCGLFARTQIPRGTHIIEYAGEKIDKRESLKRCRAGNECIFALGDEYDVDGSTEWNLARFINHSCSPNCRAEPIDGRIWIIAERDIQAGEEITFNYSYDLDDYDEHPCRCGSETCVGYMVAGELVTELRRKLERELAK